MPCRRLLGSTEPTWDTVVIPARGRAGWSEFRDFIDGDESDGFYTCVSRVKQPSRDFNGTTCWHFAFSDPRTAFAFKMRFA